MIDENGDTKDITLSSDESTVLYVIHELADQVAVL